VACFGSDDDFVLEDTVTALVQIGDPEAARCILETVPDGSDSFSFYAPGVLGRLKLPECKAALLAWLETEEDPITRTLLCNSLCDLFSERGVPVVLKEIEQGYERQMLSLQDAVLPVADVLGLPLPQAERWRRERDKERKRIEHLDRLWEAAKQRELRRLARGLPPVKDELDDEAFFDDDEVPAAEVTMPIRNVGPRVGRNDPCTCSSGKKFKKCCGRSRS
jgi:hypothetical protein